MLDIFSISITNNSQKLDFLSLFVQYSTFYFFVDYHKHLLFHFQYLFNLLTILALLIVNMIFEIVVFIIYNFE